MDKKYNYERFPTTLKEYNNKVLVPSDILTGREFRKLKRERKRNNS